MPVSPSGGYVSAKRSVVIISTGGTIEKTYDERAGTLANRRSVLDVMLSQLHLGGVAVSRVSLMNKDSLEMSDADHSAIARCVGEHVGAHQGVVVVHGTDRLAQTGERILETLGEPKVPILLTGAMRPFEVHNTDALQNLTEALCAVQLVRSGVYVAFHNRVLRFPGVVKNYARGTFCYADEVGQGDT